MALNPSDIAPVRNPGLIQRVWRAVVAREPDLGPEPLQQSTTETGRVMALQDTRLAYSKSLPGRLAVYSDADEMDNASAEFSRALHSIVNNVTASEDGEQESFDIQCEDATAKGILDDMVARTNLHDIVPSWTRRTVKYGDSFAEIVVNDAWEVASVKQLPSATMGRNEDQYGNLKMADPQFSADGVVQNDRESCAFDQFDPSGQRLVAAFSPWQIVHTRFLWDGVSKYGTSLANVARRDWRKLHALEEGMVVARLVRAYLKLVVYADGSGMAESQKQQMLKNLHDQISQTQQYADQKRGTAPSVSDNIYLTKDWVRGTDGSDHESLTKVDLIDPKNEGLSQIQDVMFFHRKYIANLWVPPAFYGFEDQVNAKATLTKEDVEYSRLLRGLQKLMTQALKQVCDTELILKGYDPATVDYDIVWPTISVEDEAASADANFKQAQSDDIYMGFGVIDRKWMQQHRFGMDEDEMAEIEEPPPPEPPVIPVPPIPKPAVAAERLTPHLEALAVSNQRILEAVATNGNGHAVHAEVAAKESGVHVHFEKGAIQNDVQPRITVQPASLKAPDVTVNVPEQAPPTVRVGGTVVNVPEQPAPNVHVHPAAPEVKVNIPAAETPGKVDIERNRDGSIRSIKRRG